VRLGLILKNVIGLFLFGGDDDRQRCLNAVVARCPHLTVAGCAFASNAMTEAARK